LNPALVEIVERRRLWPGADQPRVAVMMCAIQAAREYYSSTGAVPPR
jgi:hypothetical protein